LVARSNVSSWPVTATPPRRQNGRTQSEAVTRLVSANGN
jgi:hypothetical protein